MKPNKKLTSRLFESAHIVSKKPELSHVGFGMVAVMKDGGRETINNITQLRFYRRLAIGWETVTGRTLDPIVITKTLKNYSNGIHQ